MFTDIAQMNDDISRQIFDDLDKQLDAQMMAELEKCQEEQSRRMDEELDQQVREVEGVKDGFDHHQLHCCLVASFEIAKCVHRFVMLSSLCALGSP